MLSIGDILLKALMSYIQNENNKGEQAREYLDMEQIVPLPLRAEIGGPDEIYYRWNQLTIELDVKKRMLSLREEVYGEYEQMKETVARTVYGHLARRWNWLPEDLKRVEPHSLKNYHATLRRAATYIHLGLTQQEKWILLILQQPMLSWHVPHWEELQYYDVEQERDNWESLKKDQRFYWSPIAKTRGEMYVANFRLLTWKENQKKFVGGPTKPSIGGCDEP